MSDAPDDAPAPMAWDSRLLIVIGDLVEDVVVWHGPDVHPGTDNRAVVQRVPGGSAANVARHAARVAAGRVGVRFVGRIGDDPLGSELARRLAAVGVDVRVQRGGRTGSVVVLVDPLGERTMFPDRGASSELDPVDPTWLAACSHVHLTGYDLDPRTSTPAGVEAAVAARRAGASVSVDLSAWTIISELGREAVLDALARVQPAVCLVNEDEARAMAWGGRRDAPPPWRAVVKRGPLPASLVEPDGRTVDVPVPHPETDVRDSTGAGDAFAAGYLVARLTGAAPVAAIEAGHRAAAAVLSAPGSGSASW